MTANLMHWNLEDIVKKTEYDQLVNESDAQLAEFEKYWEILNPNLSTKDFQKIITAYEKLSENIQRLYAYPSLEESLDETAEEPKFLKSKAKNLIVRFEDQTRRIWHWFKGKEVPEKISLDDTNAQRLFASIPALTYKLKRIRELAKHTLSEKEEAIISKKDLTGSESLKDLRSLIETEQIYYFKPSKTKKAVKMHTTAELMSYVHSSKANERKAAYEAVFKPYVDNVQKYFLIYENVVKDWSNEAKLRGYPSSISMRNTANDISDQAISTLLEVCREEGEIFRDYFRYKAKLLGMKKLTRFDLYAPVTKTKKENVPFEDALKLVLDRFKDFDLDFLAKAEKIVAEMHIDSDPGKNKSGGAFCATVSPHITPYVLLNYTGKKRDIEVMAHELGHGVHSLYASHLPITAQDAPLPLAETASTFGEMLVFDSLYEAAKTKEEKRDLLIDKIGESFATILRQNYFVLFELQAHEKLNAGIKLSDFNELYFNTLKEQFGDAVEIDPIFKYEWAYIPHIVNSPFYCYAYSFGELLSLSLYKMYKEKGRSFVPQIEEILAAGGSQNPEELLKKVGVDITKKTFWKKSFALIQDWLDELKSL